MRLAGNFLRFGSEAGFSIPDIVEVFYAADDHSFDGCNPLVASLFVQMEAHHQASAAPPATHVALTPADTTPPNTPTPSRTRDLAPNLSSPLGLSLSSSTVRPSASEPAQLPRNPAALENSTPSAPTTPRNHRRTVFPLTPVQRHPPPSPVTPLANRRKPARGALSPHALAVIDVHIQSQNVVQARARAAAAVAAAMASRDEPADATLAAVMATRDEAGNVSEAFVADYIDRAGQIEADGEAELAAAEAARVAEQILLFSDVDPADFSAFDPEDLYGPATQGPTPPTPSSSQLPPAPRQRETFQVPAFGQPGDGYTTPLMEPYYPHRHPVQVGGMTGKFYVVTKGRMTGIFLSYVHGAKRVTDRVSGNEHEGVFGWENAVASYYSRARVTL